MGHTKNEVNTKNVLFHLVNTTAETLTSSKQPVIDSFLLSLSIYNNVQIL